MLSEVEAKLALPAGSSTLMMCSSSSGCRSFWAAQCRVSRLTAESSTATTNLRPILYLCAELQNPKQIKIIRFGFGWFWRG